MPGSRAVVLILKDGSVARMAPRPLAAQVDAITKRKHYREAVGVAEDALARLEATAASTLRLDFCLHADVSTVLPFQGLSPGGGGSSAAVPCLYFVRLLPYAGE
jgi:hypothetical protein